MTAVALGNTLGLATCGPGTWLLQRFWFSENFVLAQILLFRRTRAPAQDV